MVLRTGGCPQSVTSVNKRKAQHDKNKDGFLTKDEVIQLSESLLVSSASRTLNG